MKNRNFHLMAWACGTGDKEIEFSLGWPQPPRSWTAVDISSDLVQSTIQRARPRLDPVPLHGMTCDLSRVSGAPSSIPSDGPILHLLFGVLPNQSPEWMLGKFRSWLKPGDLLVAGINCLPADTLQARQEIGRQYNNPETRAWLAQALKELDVDPDTVSWSWAWKVSSEGWGRYLTCHVKMNQDGQFKLDGNTFSYSKSDSLELFSTNRFLINNLNNWQPPAPLQVVQTLVSSCGEEGVLFLEKQGNPDGKNTGS
jgi:hypothetical protein